MPICGGVNVERLKKVKNVPIRIFHGTADDVVRVEFSENAYNELKKAGSTKAEIILFPGVGHGSWIPAFASDDFLSWMYKQKK
ncbi:MAG: prolyl oligopeptidase family serine peptidase [Paludibacteraceae bacterium]